MPHPLLIWENEPPEDLRSPVLVVALDGWIDAGYAAATAMGRLKLQVRTHRLVSFDTDELLDQRARRPVMRVANGRNTGLRWPRLQIRHGRDAAGQDLLVLTGPEPDFRWHAFLDALMEVVDRCGVRMAVGFGAFPGPAPHTRPVSIHTTATTDELARWFGPQQLVADVPAGMSAAIEQAFADHGLPAIGLWARVPHYVATMPFPSGAAALLDGFARITGAVVDTVELHEAGANAITQIEQLVSNNPEHVQMVRALEAQVDAEADGPADTTPSGVLGPLPSADELAAELEQFLRDQKND